MKQGRIKKRKVGKWTQVQPQQVAAMLLLFFAGKGKNGGGGWVVQAKIVHYKKFAISQ